MKKERSTLGIQMVGLLILFSTLNFAHPINDYYKAHKGDAGMDAKIIPPKLAALLVDDDYEEAIDILQSLTALRYMNYSGNKEKVNNYAKQATAAKGNYKELLSQTEGNQKIAVYGIQKKGEIRKLMVVVETNSEFLLMIGKGKLTDKQIRLLPELAKEI